MGVVSPDHRLPQSNRRLANRGLATPAGTLHGELLCQKRQHRYCPNQSRPHKALWVTKAAVAAAVAPLRGVRAASAVFLAAGSVKFQGGAQATLVHCDRSVRYLAEPAYSAAALLLAFSMYLINFQ